jgi:hypothetical protein
MFMSAKRLAGLQHPTLADVRYFLFCVLQLGCVCGPRLGCCLPVTAPHPTR